MTLTRNQIENIVNYYVREYNVWESFPNLAKTMGQHGNSTFHLYRKLCQIKNWLILSEEKKLSTEIPSKKEYIFLREIFRACFIKVMRQAKLTEPLRSEYKQEILFTILKYK